MNEDGSPAEDGSNSNPPSTTVDDEAGDDDDITTEVGGEAEDHDDIATTVDDDEAEHNHAIIYQLFDETTQAFDKLNIGFSDEILNSIRTIYGLLHGMDQQECCKIHLTPLHFYFCMQFLCLEIRDSDPGAALNCLDNDNRKMVCKEVQNLMTNLNIATNMEQKALASQVCIKFAKIASLGKYMDEMLSMYISVIDNDDKYNGFTKALQRKVDNTHIFQDITKGRHHNTCIVYGFINIDVDAITVRWKANLAKLYNILVAPINLIIWCINSIIKGIYNYKSQKKQEIFKFILGNNIANIGQLHQKEYNIYSDFNANYIGYGYWKRQSISRLIISERSIHKDLCSRRNHDIHRCRHDYNLIKLHTYYKIVLLRSICLAVSRASVVHEGSWNAMLMTFKASDSLMQTMTSGNAVRYLGNKSFPLYAKKDDTLSIDIVESSIVGQFIIQMYDIFCKLQKFAECQYNTDTNYFNHSCESAEAMCSLKRKMTNFIKDLKLPGIDNTMLTAVVSLLDKKGSLSDEDRDVIKKFSGMFFTYITGTSNPHIFDFSGIIGQCLFDKIIPAYLSCVQERRTRVKELLAKSITALGHENESLIEGMADIEEDMDDIHKDMDDLYERLHSSDKPRLILCLEYIRNVPVSDLYTKAGFLSLLEKQKNYNKALINGMNVQDAYNQYDWFKEVIDEYSYSVQLNDFSLRNNNMLDSLTTSQDKLRNIKSEVNEFISCTAEVDVRSFYLHMLDERGQPMTADEASRDSYSSSSSSSSSSSGDSDDFSVVGSQGLEHFSTNGNEGCNYITFNYHRCMEYIQDKISDHINNKYIRLSFYHILDVEQFASKKKTISIILQAINNDCIAKGLASIDLSNINIDPLVEELSFYKGMDEWIKIILHYIQQNYKINLEKIYNNTDVHNWIEVLINVCLSDDRKTLHYKQMILQERDLINTSPDSLDAVYAVISDTSKRIMCDTAFLPLGKFGIKIITGIIKCSDQYPAFITCLQTKLCEMLKITNDDNLRKKLQECDITSTSYFAVINAHINGTGGEVLSIESFNDIYLKALSGSKLYEIIFNHMSRIEQKQVAYGAQSTSGGLLSFLADQYIENSGVPYENMMMAGTIIIERNKQDVRHIYEGISDAVAKNLCQNREGMESDAEANIKRFVYNELKGSSDQDIFVPGNLCAVLFRTNALDTMISKILLKVNTSTKSNLDADRFNAYFKKTIAYFQEKSSLKEDCDLLKDGSNVLELARGKLHVLVDIERFADMDNSEILKATLSIYSDPKESGIIIKIFNKVVIGEGVPRPLNAENRCDALKNFAEILQEYTLMPGFSANKDTLSTIEDFVETINEKDKLGTRLSSPGQQGALNPDEAAKGVPLATR